MMKIKLNTLQYDLLPLLIVPFVGIWLYKLANDFLPEMLDMPVFEGYFFYWLAVTLVYTIVLGILSFIYYFLRKKVTGE